MHEALFWSSEAENKVRCRLCPHECLIAEGRAGICHVRRNTQGKLISEVYGEPAAIHSDPIEKKPLYHFYPGSPILSTGTYGCNLHCSFCQNYHLSQRESDKTRPGNGISPGDLVNKARNIPHNLGMAYTYNEPTVFYEYMLDTAIKIHAAGMKNVMVSNGFISSEPLEKLLPFMDAFNIDLKSFSDDFYRKMTGGRLQPVLETLKSISVAGKHLEITLLVIPGLNDTPEEFEEMTDWIAKELGTDIPLHLSRYFPANKLSLPPTPTATLNQFAMAAAEKLHYVFTGNVNNDDHSSTFCPRCHTELIYRSRYDVSITGLTVEGKCGSCGAETGIKV